MISKYTKAPVLVQPATDLGLKEIQAALTLKNAKIEQNYINIQANMDKASKLDVIRGVDKDYLQSQMNFATQSLNSIGGDLSDIRNAYQANSIINDVFKDKNIQSALISTANIRNIQKQREQINNNPKLMKYKNAINESYDNDLINSYINNTNLGQTFDKRGATLGVDTDEIYTQTAKATEIKNREEHRNGDPLTRYAVKERSAADIKKNIFSTMNTNTEALEQEKRNFAYVFKNPKAFVDSANEQRDTIISNITDEIVRLDCIKETLEKQGNTEQAKKYEEAKIAQQESKKAYLENKLDLNDPDLTSKAFNIFREDKANSYANRYKTYSEVTTLDPVAKFKYQEKQKDLRFDETKRQADIANSFRQQQLNIQSKGTLNKISPGVKKEYDETGEVKMPLENQYASDKKSLEANFDGIKANADALKSLKDTNVKLASEIVYRQRLQGGVVADKINEFISKGYISNMEDSKKRVIKDQFLFSNSALTQINTLIDQFDNTQGQVLSAENANTKAMLDEIAKNNFKYGVLEAQKNNIFKRYGITEQDFVNTTLPKYNTSDIRGGMGDFSTNQSNIISPNSKNIEGAKKEFNKLMQSEGLTSMVPIASINVDDSKKGDFSNTRQQIMNEAISTGVYSPSNPNKLYSMTGYINGKPVKQDILGKIVDKDDPKREVDWGSSLANVIPGQQEVVYQLKDKDGNSIKTKEFPDGEMRVKVKTETVNALLDAVGSGRTINDFINGTEDYDYLKRLKDSEANNYTKNTLYPITGLSSKYNVKFSIKKNGDRFEIGIPALGKTLLYSSIDEFNKNFIIKFQDMMRRIEIEPAYKEHRDKSDQEKLNVILDAFKLDILRKGTL